MANILITGIAGGYLSQRVAAKPFADGNWSLASTIAKSARRCPRRRQAQKSTAPTYNKTIIEDVFRHNSFDAVMHLGRAFSLKESVGKRFDLNVVGSQKIMNLAVQHNVPSLVVLSTFHIYGAHPSNHIPIAEDEPLRGCAVPEIADAHSDGQHGVDVGVSASASEPTCVLSVDQSSARPIAQHADAVFGGRAMCRHLLGFNPMMQFLHEDDLADAIIAAWRGRRSAYTTSPAMKPSRGAPRFR